MIRSCLAILKNTANINDRNLGTSCLPFQDARLAQSDRHHRRPLLGARPRQRIYFFHCAAGFEAKDLVFQFAKKRNSFIREIVSIAKNNLPAQNLQNRFGETPIPTRIIAGLTSGRGHQPAARLEAYVDIRPTNSRFPRLDSRMCEARRGR